MVEHSQVGAGVVINELPDCILEFPSGVRAAGGSTILVQEILVENVVHQIQILGLLQQIIRKSRIVRVPHFGWVQRARVDCDVNVSTPPVVFTVKHSAGTNGDIPETSHKVAELHFQVHHVRKLNFVVARAPSR